ncbi:2-hydroxyacid dehydrogenase [Nakamurella leprariae]|uniref:2-hydroxyacid dehydrogenase n=1 Tax=Nakamurella leprariae TaxID=2803911 RepID=A0A939C2Y3_9ACTN|nr:2-hydroxyacid dehydrogenase [Nakamurella leprariae]MBM9468567.1 2-hydroxyacid dehydrogenase [Nakamurella leprariae]
MIVTVPRQDVLDGVGDAPDGHEYRVWDLQSPAADVLGADDAARIGMVLWPYPAPNIEKSLLTTLPELRLVQVMTAGYEGVADLLPDGVGLANARGAHATSTAEFAVTLVLAKLRGIDRWIRNAAEGRWRSERRPSLADRSVLVVGAGSIGSAIHDRLVPFEVTVTRVGTTARDDERGHVHAASELFDLLPDHQVVILIAPQTPETTGLVDARFLAAMPDGALLVNVARGPLVVTDDLLAAVRSGRVEAALDVTDPEPLPADHPLWHEPGVIIAPHVGGFSTAGPPRMHRVLREQIEAFAAGAPSPNLVVPPRERRG